MRPSRGPRKDFYPRPPRGGRPVQGDNRPKIKIFLSTPSARRATTGHRGRHPRLYHFYPRPPRGGRPLPIRAYAMIWQISIHALREEGDVEWAKNLGIYKISIHALREEGDAVLVAFYGSTQEFLSTPSARRATASLARSAHSIGIFLSTPSARRATRCLVAGIEDILFLSTPSARRATQELGHNSLHPLFLSTPSARRATAKTETKSLFSNKLYNILHEFRRALIYNGSKNYPNHAK